MTTKFEQWKASLTVDEVWEQWNLLREGGCEGCPARDDCAFSGRYDISEVDCEAGFRKWALTEVVYHDD